MSEPLRLVPFGPDLNASQFDPRPRRRGRKRPLTPAEQCLVAAREAQAAAYEAYRRAEAAWQCATSAVVAALQQIDVETADREWHLQDAAVAGGQSSEAVGS